MPVRKQQKEHAVMTASRCKMLGLSLQGRCQDMLIPDKHIHSFVSR